jgi:hypothetical protein
MALLELVNNDPKFFYYSGLGNFNQRSISYGNDQPGGGNSGQPYMVTPIPPVFQQQSESNSVWLSDNGLIRGGFAGATKASIDDTIRIGKFLKTAPRGPLFIAKQIGLQLSNPRPEFRNNLLGQIAGQIGATRIYNLGINTLAQIPLTAFGGHIVRHGLLPILNEGSVYSRIVTANNAVGTFGENNRLVQLKDKLVTYPDSNIASYVGGAGSIDGIGTTTIRRYVNTLSNPTFSKYATIVLEKNTPGVNVTDLSYLYRRPYPDVDYFLAQGVSEQYWDGDKADIKKYNHISTGSFTSPPSQIDQNVLTKNYGTAERTYRALRGAINLQIQDASIGVASPTGSDRSGPVTFRYTGKAYSGKNKNLPLSNYNIEKRLGLSGQNRSDQINLTPLYISNAPPNGRVSIDGRNFNVRDLIYFTIEAVDGDNPENSVWMVFRALLKDITDNPNPSWNTVNYIGRGEPFYIYKGFERSLSFNFQVAAMSEAELKPMWQKLNYLYSNTMPDYSGNVMRGPFMKLTIGNYMHRQPGIIKSLTYTISNDSPWEISINDPELTAAGIAGGNPLYELPHVLNVSMTFAPIHDFLPRKMSNQFNRTVVSGEGLELQVAQDWANLPAFVVDRNDNQNKWLTDIYSSEGQTKIPYDDLPAQLKALKSVQFPPASFDEPNVPIEITNDINVPVSTTPDFTALDQIIEARFIGPLP